MSEMAKRLDADLVVIGGGGAGLAAALTAAEKGCKSIIVLEKAGALGGSTAMSHDIFGAESPVQRRVGVDAQRDDLFKKAMEWSHWSKINPRIVRAFIDKSGDTIRWLEEKGIEFELTQYFPNQVPWVRHYMVRGQGAELIKVLKEQCSDLGVKIFNHTRATKLLRGKNGEAIGVLAETKNEELKGNGDGYIQITAKAVIVTTGGYGNNQEMLKKYCSYYQDTMVYDGVRANTGDGVTMAMEAGVSTVGLGTLVLHGPFSRGAAKNLKIDAHGPDGGPMSVRFSDLGWEPYTLWVNKVGRRYIDEAYHVAFFAHGNALALQPEGIAYTLFDSSTMQRMEEQGFYRTGIFGAQTLHGFTKPGIPLPGLARAAREAPENDFLKVANSWDELAGWIGCDTKVLTDTIDEYNASCSCGHDPLFAKEGRYLLPLNTPPFYAIKGHGCICEALGGIKINEKMEAIDLNDDLIPGLYSAGATTGGWESESYCYHLTGHLVGFALNSGRIAGENAVNFITD